MCVCVCVYAVPVRSVTKRKYGVPIFAFDPVTTPEEEILVEIALGVLLEKPRQVSVLKWRHVVSPWLGSLPLVQTAFRLVELELRWPVCFWIF